MIKYFMKFPTRPSAQNGLRLDKTKFNFVDVNHLRLLNDRMQNLQRSNSKNYHFTFSKLG